MSPLDEIFCNFTRGETTLRCARCRLNFREENESETKWENDESCCLITGYKVLLVKRQPVKICFTIVEVCPEIPSHRILIRCLIRPSCVWSKRNVVENFENFPLSESGDNIIRDNENQENHFQQDTTIVAQCRRENCRIMKVNACFVM